MTKHSPRVGVIGGGQLARMMTPPAINLGIQIKVLAEAEGSSAQLATSMVGDYNQLDVVREFARGVDVITFDHEHVPISVLQALEAEGVNIQPPSKALAFAQNKLHMRQRLSALGLPMPAWAEIRDAASLDDFIAANGGVAILKTPIGGYDGKGVRVVRASVDAKDWLENLASFGGSLLAEEKVDFVRELAQLSARTPSGEFQAWPLVETIQENGVCSVVLAPSPEATAATLQTTAAIAKQIAEALGVTGVLAVEMFEARDGRIVINELAMRPHNSGHFSIEGSVTSQFEQHIRAVLDLPLGSTAPRAAHAVMVNLLGVDEQNNFVQALDKALAAHPDAKVHTYGKGARAGRKMGHVTVVADSAEHALAEARGAAAVLLRG
ncbi:5-(carboxyamino)imidazole ribonucleotide synthase [Rhodoluna lacicola]|uniref:N5-carboxyaminoimidazole ribonucleotide synthase n=1 Tax=Rhodoluna lacicola TaxID=529884 RepID=A0A060JH93_9MICO|nr:5-(carboxyamino)imidazole ribonucleotide synthase [Rhodoluna lacicola]AIC47922.1 phosphoribosylaminoimidazole carboxylase, PurK protein [Rhodoluna lacicola]